MLCYIFDRKNKKIMYTPVNPSFTFIKVGCKGYTLHGHVSMMTKESVMLQEKKNKKINNTDNTHNVYPCKPQFNYIKVEFDA